MGRRRATASGLLKSALFAVALLAPGQAAAAPQLEASISWQGDCDDRAALRAEAAARGADLLEVEPSESALNLGVVVRQTPTPSFIAEIELSAPGSHEQRVVEARECLALRRAVAWLLAVLAEEREAAKRASEPAAGEFPAPKLPTSPTTPPTRPAPPRPVATQPAAAPPRRRSAVCARPGPRWQLGAELVAGFGLVEAAALGPALVGAYVPCARGLPIFVLGASQLVSLGYEVDGRAIAMQRTTAQAGAWVTLGVPALRGGVSLEAGRIHATGAPSAQGPGDSSAAPWLAFLVPVRLSLPLLPPALSAELGVAAAYTPLSFVLRYASGEALGPRSSHLELRTALGLSGRF